MCTPRLYILVCQNENIIQIIFISRYKYSEKNSLTYSHLLLKYLLKFL